MRIEYRNDGKGIRWRHSEEVLILTLGVPAELGRGLGNLERVKRIRSSGQGLSHQPVVSYSRKNPSVDFCASLRGAFKWGERTHVNRLGVPGKVGQRTCVFRAVILATYHSDHAGAARFFGMVIVCGLDGTEVSGLNININVRCSHLILRSDHLQRGKAVDA